MARPSERGAQELRAVALGGLTEGEHAHDGGRQRRQGGGERQRAHGHGLDRPPQRAVQPRRHRPRRRRRSAAGARRCGSAGRRSRTARGTPPWRAGRRPRHRPRRRRRRARRRAGCRCRRAAARPSRTGGAATARPRSVQGRRDAEAEAEARSGGSPTAGTPTKAATPERAAEGQDQPLARREVEAGLGSGHRAEHDHGGDERRSCSRSGAMAVRANRPAACSTAVATAPSA